MSPVSPEQWREVKAVFQAAVERTPEERSAFLAEACAGDAALKAEVELLLAADERANGFLEPPPARSVIAPTLAASFRTALAGRYAIERELGRGGMATVYLAEDVRHNRPVALKVLRADLTATLGAERFLREIEIATRLQHPGILPVLDSGEAAGQLWFTMPYVEGETLRERLAREGQLRLHDALEIARAAAETLDYAHRHGVVHRDVKPENILLSDGRALVADFGIARALDAAGGERLTRSGVMVGTPPYMSPEQARGDGRLDGRSDIYSLGCVLYEMIAGEPPFGGQTPQAVLAKQLTQSPCSLRAIRDTVPATVEGVVGKALSKSPIDRFATAAEFAQALAEARDGLADRPAVHDSAVTDSRAAWWLRSRLSARPLVLGVGLAILAAAVAVGAALLQRPRPPAALDPNLVVVAPFEVLDPKLSLWREGLVDVLSASLDGAGPLRTVSPTVVIRRWKGRADRSSAAELGRRTGAGLAVFGELIGMRGDSVRLRATLLDVAHVHSMAEFELREPSVSMDRLMDSLAVAILRELGRTRPIAVTRLASLGSSSLPAIKEFLQGEQFYRRTMWDSARAHYERAVALDSTFTLAIYRIGDDFRLPLSVTRAYAFRAAALNHGLPPRESLLVVASSLWAAVERAGTSRQADSVSWPLRTRLLTTLEGAARRYPEDPEIWFVLGDARFHFGMPFGVTDQQALDAFDRAIALDSTFAPSYVHALQLAGRLRSAAKIRRYAAAYLAFTQAADQQRPSSTMEIVELADRLLDPTRAGSRETQRLLETMPALSPSAVWHVVQTVPDSAEVAVLMARLAVDRFDVDSNWYAASSPMVERMALASTLAYRGHLEEAYQTVGREDFPFFISYFDLATGYSYWEGSVANAIGLSAELALQGADPPDAATVLFHRWLRHDPFWPAGGLVFALPWWSAQSDTTALLEFARRAESAARHVPATNRELHINLDDPRYGAAAARAYLALARRDTAQAMRRLAALPIVKCRWCFLERLTLARLLEARRRDREALALLEPGFPLPFAYPTYPVWELELARVAERVGERERAAESYRFIVDVWRNADPKLQPYVAEARAALQRLGKS